MLEVFAVRRLPVISRIAVPLELERFGTRFTCWVADGSEMRTIVSVMLKEEYRLPASFQPRTILDLGSNIGVSLIYFALRYPSARVIGLEPDPHTFARLARNVERFPNIEVLPVAVGGGNGVRRFYHNDAASWASSVHPAPGSIGVEVQALTLDAVLDRLGLETVDLIKIDVEGAELEVIESFSGLDARTSMVIGEFHHFMPELADAGPRFFAHFSRFDLDLRTTDPGETIFAATRRG